MRKRTKKLHLNKETLLSLNSKQLGKVMGADSQGNTCPHSDCVGSCPPGCSGVKACLGGEEPINP